MAGVTNPGKVTTVEMPQWTIRSQVLREVTPPTDAVQRLDVGGFEGDALGLKV